MKKSIFPSVHNAKLSADIWDFHYDGQGKGVFLFYSAGKPGALYWLWQPIHMWN